MIEIRDSNRIVHLDAILVVVILFCSLLIYNNSLKVNDGLKNKPVSASMLVIEKTGITTPCIRLKIFQKEWISNKDNFSLLAFNRNPLSENKKAGIKVLQFHFIRRGSQQIPQFILRYHLFPMETDEFPILS
jgi:cell division protein YceG involved in septum cleavage